MSVAGKERRHDEAGSIICENGHLRLRVFRIGRTLGISLDTPEAAHGTFSLGTGGEELVWVNEAGVPQVGAFFAFDPVEVGGQTRGVSVHGHVGDAAATLTVVLDGMSTWCRQRLSVTGLTGGVGRLTHSWRLQPDERCPEIVWPAAPVTGAGLACCPAALLQHGTQFAALAAEIDDEDPAPYGAEVQVTEGVSLGYGLWQGAPTGWVPGTPLHLSCLLNLDVRALPGRGFQEVVRLLGSREELTLVGRSPVRPAAGPLPELTAAAPPAEWHPFVWEGVPAAIAAGVKHQLDRAAAGDWPALEDGLCWLDRLCLQQRLLGAPDDPALGVFGPDAKWRQITVWMPALLLQAFRLTGIPEYGFRAQAALHALPAAQQAAALAALRPRFGDLYAQADYGEFITLAGPEVTGAHFTPDGLALAVTPSPAYPTLRLVLDGTEPHYALTLNGLPLGTFPTTELSTGVEIPVAG